MREKRRYLNALYHANILIFISVTFREKLSPIIKQWIYKLLNTFEFIKAVSGTVFEMINAFIMTIFWFLSEQRFGRSSSPTIGQWMKLILIYIWGTINALIFNWHYIDGLVMMRSPLVSWGKYRSNWTILENKKNLAQTFGFISRISLCLFSIKYSLTFLWRNSLSSFMVIWKCKEENSICKQEVFA